MESSFLVPPRLRADDGEIRTCGIELEFGGLDLAATAEAVAQALGASAEQTRRYVFEVPTDHGPWTIELDWSHAPRLKLGERAAKLGGSETWRSWGERLETSVVEIATTVVPIEVVTPPLPMDAMDPVEAVREALHRAGARGTDDSVRFAFGLHFNPQAPSLDAATLLDYLRAFLVLYSWLDPSPDLTRRWLTPYIKPFPDEYILKVLDPSYAPDDAAFLRDYLADNESRNRPLDMLPLLACIDEDTVTRISERIDLLSPRPTFHYRLPPCKIDDPDWRVAIEWEPWVRVERLASDRSELAAACRRYLDRPPPAPTVLDSLFE